MAETPARNINDLYALIPSALCVARDRPDSQAPPTRRAAPRRPEKITGAGLGSQLRKDVGLVTDPHARARRFRMDPDTHDLVYATVGLTMSERF
jgi:hypothetical protein